MAQVLYINPDPDTQDRATQLGCGWMPTVPPQFANIAEAPCVILNGVGRQVVLPDDGTLTNDQVMADLQPMLDEEQAAADAAVQQANLVAVQVDPDAVQTALTNGSKATTVAGLRSAFVALAEAILPTNGN